MNVRTQVLAAVIVASMAHAANAAGEPASALSGDRKLTLQFSPYSYHYHYDPEHRPVHMIGIERESLSGGALDGVAAFTNSFGQPVVYVYPWGHVYHDLFGIDRLSFKWTAGLMYGYLPPYEDKVPLNYKGLSPVAIPAFTYAFDRQWAGQLNLIGTAALMFQVNRVLP